MGDNNRGRERDRERTIIHTRNGGGGGGTIIAVIAGILLLVILMFVLFGGWLRDTTDALSVPDNVSVNINIDGPEGQMPDVDATEPDAPAPEPDGNTG